MTLLYVVRAVLAALALGVAVFGLVLIGLAAAMRTRPYDLLPPSRLAPAPTPRGVDGGEDGPAHTAPNGGGVGRHPHRHRCGTRQLPSNPKGQHR